MILNDLRLIYHDLNVSYNIDIDIGYNIGYNIDIDIGYAPVPERCDTGFFMGLRREFPATIFRYPDFFS